MYTFDTNAIIYYINDDVKTSAIVRDIFEKNYPVYISTITEIELFAFPQLTGVEEAEIEKLLKTISIISIDSRIAREAGSLRKAYHLSVPDSAIAATALFTGSTLLTRNVRDFKNVPNLRVQEV